MSSAILMTFCVFALSCEVHGVEEEHHATNLPGGTHGLNLSDEWIALSWRAVNEGVNKETNCTYYSVPIKILKAHSLPVSGIKYLGVLIGASNCPKNTVSHEQVDSTRCALNENSNIPKQICQFKVLQRASENFEHVTNKGCTIYVEGSSS